MKTARVKPTRSNKPYFNQSRYKRTARLVLAALVDHQAQHKSISVNQLMKYIVREYDVHEAEIRDYVPRCIAYGIAFGAIKKSRGLLMIGAALVKNSTLQVAPSLAKSVKMSKSTKLPRIKRETSKITKKYRKRHCPCTNFYVRKYKSKASAALVIPRLALDAPELKNGP